MYTLFNSLDCELNAELKSDSELIDKVNQIRIENEDFDFSILGVSDAIEYINDYCDNQILVKDSEVEEFLEAYGIEVEDNEPSHYVELMMDNHKCVKFKDKQYYISDSLCITEDEQKIEEFLLYSN